MTRSKRISGADRERRKKLMLNKALLAILF